MSQLERLPGSRLLARNTLVNLGGYGVTLVVAFLAVPILIDALGVDRFGVLALAWIVIGYGAVLDLGLGRALTKLAAERIGTRRETEIPGLFWSALGLLLALGALVGLLLAAVAPWLVRRVLDVPADLEGETIAAFRVLAASLPLAITGAGARGYLEACQRFDLVNAIVIPVSVVTYFGPVLALELSDTLAAAVAAVVASRAIVLVSNVALALRVTPALRRAPRLARRAIDPLLRFGGWYSAWNVATAALLTLDRFLIGAVLTVGAVTYYAIPYEVTARLLVIGYAVVGVLFPAFAATVAVDPARASRLFDVGLRVLFAIVFPITLALATFAHEGLSFWIDERFADNSAHVLRWLAFGVFVQSLALVPGGLLQTARVDVAAKLVLIELPLYVAALVLALEYGGIEGAAIAWAGRALVDAVLLLVLVRRHVPATAGVGGWLVPALAGAAGAFVVGAALQDAALEGGFLAVVLGAFAALGWSRLLGEEERAAVRKRLRLRGG